MHDAKKTPNLFYIVLLPLVCLAGLVHILEPNLGGAYGSSDTYSLARLLGWIAIGISAALLSIELNISLETQDRILGVDIFVYGLCGIAIISGAIGALTGMCPGMLKTLRIKTIDMQILEGAYALAGLALSIYYTLKRQALFHFLFEDEN